MIQAFGLTSDHRKDLPPAVDDVSFEAHAGRVTALLGQSGAGKTTTLRLMLELQPGRGITYFKGRPLHRIPHPSHEVGVLLGEVPGHPSRTVRGHLRMLCAAAGVPARRADEVLEVVGLVSLREERLGTLSRGTDRRLGLACALLADPHTLVLDEPADGISGRERRWLHGMLRAHAAQGGTVLYTTADPKEAARTADRVVTLDRGRIVADQAAADFGRHRLRPRVAVRSPHATRLAALLTKEARTQRRSVEVVREDDNRLSVYGSTCADVGEAAFRHGILVHQLADEVGDMGPGAGPAPASASQTAERPEVPAVPSVAPEKVQVSGQAAPAGVREPAAGDRRPVDPRFPGGEEKRSGTERPGTTPTPTASHAVRDPKTPAPARPQDGPVPARPDGAGGGCSHGAPVPARAARAPGTGRTDDVFVEVRAEDAGAIAPTAETPAAERGDNTRTAAHGGEGAAASSGVRKDMAPATPCSADGAVTVRPDSRSGADRAGDAPATAESAAASPHAPAARALPAHARRVDPGAPGQEAGTSAPVHAPSLNGSGGTVGKGEPDRAYVPTAPARTDLKTAPARTDVQAQPARADVQAGPARAGLQTAPARSHLQAGPAYTDSQAASARGDLRPGSAHADSQAASARGDLRPGPAHAGPQAASARSDLDAGPAHAGPQAASARSDLDAGPAHAGPQAASARSDLDAGPAHAGPQAVSARSDLDAGPAHAGPQAASARSDLRPGSAHADSQAASARGDLRPGPARTGPQAASARSDLDAGPAHAGPQAASARSDLRPGPAGAGSPTAPVRADLPTGPVGRRAPASSAHADAPAGSARTDPRSNRTQDRTWRTLADTPLPAAGSVPAADSLRRGTRTAPWRPAAREAPARTGRPVWPLRHRNLPGAPPSATAQTPIPTPRPAEAARWDGFAVPPPICVRPGAGPLRPLRYELRRAAGIGTGFVTGAVVLALSALTALLLGRVGHTPQPRLLAGWPQLLPLPPAALGAGLLGALSFGDEFRHPALAADRGTVPRRLGLLAAKLLVATATALALAFLAIGCDAEVLYVVYGAELTGVPGDWLWLGASWTGLVVGCAWAGVLAAGLFRSTAAGVAAVLAVPVIVAPLLQWALGGSAATRLAPGLPVRLRHMLLLQWPFGGDRYLVAAARLIAQPLGAALTLSLVTLACAYLFTVLRSRAQ
ncbi:ATP-binding cassette domain-containing protein [Streptomyces sp. NPDC046831]|uniref:ATP-binding cassette domain-containing protein n=1 Tax=Streptomyces sp. NPDC046831 TaxID=3154805 RepID=UPI0033DDE506